MAAAAEALWAWPWSRDMILQPVIRPLERILLRPALEAVSVGTEPLMTVEEAGAVLHNPLAATPENVTAGRKLYSTYCYPCHGSGGLGDGPVAGGALAPANLTNPLIQQKTDGHFYGVMRNGIRTMVGYHEALNPRERWQVVLYLRTLAPARSGAAAKPQ